jgi:O-antigen/teichoic acid export membrane protein
MNLLSNNVIFKNIVILLFSLISFFLKFESFLWFILLIGYLVSSFPFLTTIKQYFFKSKNLIKLECEKIIQFSYPLILTSFLVWVTNYSDRFFLDYYLNNDAVGLYSAIYSLGSKFFLLLSPIFLTFITSKIFITNEILVKRQVVTEFSLKFLIVSIPIILIVYFFSYQIGSLFLSKNYSDAFDFLYIIVLAYFFLVFTFLFEQYYYSVNKTKTIFFGNLIAAIINIGLNFWLIPIWGILGASVSTLFTFICRFLFIIFNFYYFESSNSRLNRV